MLISFGTIAVVASGVAAGASMLNSWATEKKTQEYINQQVKEELSHYNLQPKEEEN